MDSTRRLPLPQGQESWYELYQAFIKVKGGAGGCIGFASVGRNAEIAAKIPEFRERIYQIYYGLPDPKSTEQYPLKRIDIQYLKKIAEDLNIPLDEEKIQEIKLHPEQDISHSISKNIYYETETASSELPKLFGVSKLSGMISTPLNEKIVRIDSQDSTLIPDLIKEAELPPHISKIELIKQIELAKNIRAGFIRKINQEAKTNEHSTSWVDNQKNQFANNYPFIEKLINMEAFFISAAVYQEENPQLESSLPPSERDNLVSPISLDKKNGETGVAQLGKFKGTYSFENLDKLFGSLEEEWKKAQEIQSNPAPLTINLTSRKEHGISLSYKGNSTWLMIDAASPPPYEIPSSKLAHHLLLKMTFLPSVVYRSGNLSFLLFRHNKEWIFGAETWKNKNAATEDEQKISNKLHSFKDILKTHISLEGSLCTHHQQEEYVKKIVTAWENSLDVKTVQADSKKNSDELINKYNLGIYYEQGIEGFPQDFVKAFECFSIAANEGNLNAVFNLGQYYEAGKGCAKDDKEAFNCYKKAALGGIVQAKSLLGYCYSVGLGTTINPKLAFKWIKEAAKQDDIVSIYNLGSYLEAGFGCEKDLKAAFENFRKVANSSDASLLSFISDAQFKLYQFLKDGIGIEKNEAEALNWLKKATAANHEQAKEIYALHEKEIKLQVFQEKINKALTAQDEKALIETCNKFKGSFPTEYQSFQKHIRTSLATLMANSFTNNNANAIGFVLNTLEQLFQTNYNDTVAALKKSIHPICHQALSAPHFDPDKLLFYFQLAQRILPANEFQVVIDKSIEQVVEQANHAGLLAIKSAIDILPENDRPAFLKKIETANNIIDDKMIKESEHEGRSHIIRDPNKPDKTPELNENHSHEKKSERSPFRH